MSAKTAERVDALEQVQASTPEISSDERQRLRAQQVGAVLRHSPPVEQDATGGHMGGAPRFPWHDKTRAAEERARREQELKRLFGAPKRGDSAV